MKESIGTSQIPSGLLDSLADDAYRTLIQAEDELRLLSGELSDAKEHVSEITKMHHSIRIWSRIFDISSCEAKKMILSSALQRVGISKGYKINIIYSDAIQKMMDALE